MGARAPARRDIERADSLAVDAHKWLNVPNGVGLVLFRDAELHRETFAGGAGYLTPGAGRNLHELGIEASRHALVSAIERVGDALASS